MGKNNMGFFYGKLYNSCNRTFSVGNGEKFIAGTGLIVLPDDSVSTGGGALDEVRSFL